MLAESPYSVEVRSNGSVFSRQLDTPFSSFGRKTITQPSVHIGDNKE